MYCFKFFYTLKPSTHIKINFTITPKCFGPIGPSSGSTSFLSQSYHEHMKLTTLDIKDLYINLPTQGVLQAAKFWLHKSLNNE